MIRLKPIKLVGLTEHSLTLIDYYNNEFLLESLYTTSDNKLKLFCMSKDKLWSGSFIIGEDVLFKKEYSAYFRR